MNELGRDDFERRVTYISREYAAGRGFDAPGTLGRSHYYRKPRQLRLAVVTPAIIVFVGLFGLKGMIHFHTGALTYNQRVSDLSQAEGFNRLGAALMRADPITLWVSDMLRRSLSG